MSHYISFSTKEVNRDDFPNFGRIFVGHFENARELQEILYEKIHCFPKFKNPKSCRAVIRRFCRYTGEDVIY